MRCTTPLPTLLRLMRLCTTLVTTRQTLPITEHLLFEAKDDALTITATNLETTMIARCPATVRTEGAITLPGKTLLEILRELHGETVEFHHKANGGETLIQSEGSRFHLRGLLPQDFPRPPLDGPPNFVTVEQNALATLLREALPAIGHDHTRFIFNTLRMEWFPTATPTLRCVATDGHRLVQSELQTGQWLVKPSHPTHALLAKSAVQLLLKVFEQESQEPIHISLAPGFMKVTHGRLEILSRLVDGTYPDYQALMPKTLTPCLHFPRKDCIDTIQRIAIMAPTDTPSIDLTARPTGLLAHTQNPQLGEAQELLTATLLREDFNIRLNADYLLDALKSAPSDDLTINMESPLSPLILTNGNPARWMAIIMPIKLPETQSKPAESRRT